MCYSTSEDYIFSLIFTFYVEAVKICNINNNISIIQPQYVRFYCNVILKTTFPIYKSRADTAHVS